MNAQHPHRPRKAGPVDARVLRRLAELDGAHALRSGEPTPPVRDRIRAGIRLPCATA